MVGSRRACAACLHNWYDGRSCCRLLLRRIYQSRVLRLASIEALQYACNRFFVTVYYASKTAGLPEGLGSRGRHRHWFTRTAWRSHELVLYKFVCQGAKVIGGSHVVGCIFR